jgi:hypothetical protein
MNDQPCSETNDNVAPHRAQLLYERQIAMLGQFAEVGLEMALDIARQVKAAADDGVAMTGDPALAYARVARSVRLTLMLQTKAIKAVQHLDYLATQDAHAALQDRKVRTLRIVERIANREHGDIDTVDRLVEETAERLDRDDLYGDLLDRPLSELVDMICRDLGLDPNWPRLAQEAWARQEAASGEVGRPLAALNPHPRGEELERQTPSVGVLPVVTLFQGFGDLAHELGCAPTHLGTADIGVQIELVGKGPQVFQLERDDIGVPVTEPLDGGGTRVRRAVIIGDLHLLRLGVGDAAEVHLDIRAIFDAKAPKVERRHGPLLKQRITFVVGQRNDRPVPHRPLMLDGLKADSGHGFRLGCRLIPFGLKLGRDIVVHLGYPRRLIDAVAGILLILAGLAFVFRFPLGQGRRGRHADHQQQQGDRWKSNPRPWHDGLPLSADLHHFRHSSDASNIGLSGF